VNAEGRRRVAEETVAIVAAGGYDAPSGHRVDIAADVAAAVAGTTLHLPDDTVADGGAANPTPLIEVTAESTVEAGRRLGEDAVALVFASARNPGGGFLRGTKAQEEDIARASALHACLSAVPEFYAFHRGERDLRYSDRVIYSPRVPVFRVDTSALLDVPLRLSMITAAAPAIKATMLATFISVPLGPVRGLLPSFCGLQTADLAASPVHLTPPKTSKAAADSGVVNSKVLRKASDNKSLFIIDSLPQKSQWLRPIWRLLNQPTNK